MERVGRLEEGHSWIAWQSQRQHGHLAQAPGRDRTRVRAVQHGGSDLRVQDVQGRPPLRREGNGEANVKAYLP